MFGHVTGPTRVFEYGARWAPYNAEQIENLLRLAHRYRNKLIAIEIERRKRYREARDRYGAPAIAPAEQRVESCLEALETAKSKIAEYRRSHRSRKVPSSLKDELQEARATLREARAALKEARAAAKNIPELLVAEAEINAWAKAEKDKAYTESGLRPAHWGTESKVSQAVDKAKRSSADPKLQSWASNPWAMLAVQIQHQKDDPDFDQERLFGLVPDSRGARLRFDPVPPEAWYSPSRAERRKASRTTAHLRFGDVQVDIPIVMHRPLPPGGRIKWAYLIRRRVAQRSVYSVQLVVELPQEPRRDIGDGAVAIDIGWRLTDAGLRVAYWVDERGEKGELLLPKDWLENMAWVLEKRSERDQAFNIARSAFKKWLDQYPEIPEWMEEETQTLDQWRSPRRLYALMKKWEENRFEGDSDIFERMMAWLKKEQRLYKREGHGRDKYLRRRREIYRVFAARLRERYSHVILEDFDLRQVARRNPASEEYDDSARRMRGWAALSELRTAIAQSGLVVVKTPAEYTTRRCSICGAEADPEWDPIKRLVYRCTAGHEMDQDENAARNLLATATASVASA